jgi:hypothetical protein
MQKIISFILILSLLFSIIACSGQGQLIKGTPEQGQSLVIYKGDGKIYEGLFIKKDAEKLIYIDNTTHKAETLRNNEITKIISSNKFYDFEGNEITEANISYERGYSRTLGYGVGGFTLGTAAGFGLGLILQSAFSIAPIYPMIVMALGGTFVFGVMGNNSDREVAIKNVRDERFAKSKDKFDKELDDTKKLIESKKKEKERILKEIEKKKKEKGPQGDN